MVRPKNEKARNGGLFRVFLMLLDTA